MDNDIKSTEALKAYARKVLWRHNVTNISLLKMFDEIIDNAPTVKTYCYFCGQTEHGQEAEE